MSTEAIILRLCAAGLAILCVVAILRGLIEIVAIFRRGSARAALRPNWWVLLPFLIAVALVVSWLIDRAAQGSLAWGVQPGDFWGDPDQLLIGLFLSAHDSSLALWGPAILLLVAIPILHAFRSRSFFWHLYFFGVLGMLAMPFALVSFGTFVERETEILARERPDLYQTSAQPESRYGLKEFTPACTTALMQALHLRNFSHDHYSQTEHRSEQIAQLWLNDTFNTATIDIPAAFGCQLSQIEPNPNYLPMALTLAIYRAFVALVMLGMALRPFLSP
jgi:hypothetical protein